MNNFEREYMRIERNTGSETIDLREDKCETIECKRAWFRIEFDFMADDESVCIAWDKREQK